MTSGKSLLQLKQLAQTLSKCSLTTQSGSKLVKPPVPIFGIDGRYATALYSAASKKGKLQEVDQNIKKLLELNEKDVKFHDFLMNPLIKPAQKKEILGKSLQSKLNLDELTINFIELMAENGRMKYFPSAARAYNRSMAQTRGELNVTVTSSMALDAEMKKELDTILQSFAKGKKLLINLKVDKSILGGLIVDFDGEHYIDMSLKRKFDHYSKILQQPL